MRLFFLVFLPWLLSPFIKSRNWLTSFPYFFDWDDEIFSKSNFEAIAPFYKFQQAWTNRAYETFKDFDTYLILMYLKQKIYVDYSDRFHYMSADAFYSQDKIAIDKINLIQISKSLNGVLHIFVIRRFRRTSYIYIYIYICIIIML